METDTKQPASRAAVLLDPLVRRLAYREWNDHALRWVEEPSSHRWCAYYNGCNVAGVSTELSKSWTGYYTWMLGSRLNDFPATPEQGKQWIEVLWWEWVKRAASDYPSNDKLRHG